MRSFSAEALAAFASGRFMVRCMLKADIDGDPFCIWDDAGTIVSGGDSYTGAPSRFTVDPAISAKDQSVRNVDVALSGLDPDAVSVVRSAPWSQRPVLIQRAVIATNVPQVLHITPEFSGRLDQAFIAEDPGAPGKAQITFRAESAARELDMRGSSTRDDADQRTRDADDGFLSGGAAAINTPIRFGQDTNRRVGTPRR